MAVRYGCFLLNQNIGQLLVWLGHTKIDCRETLANLLQLMNTPLAFRRRNSDELQPNDEHLLSLAGAAAAPLLTLTDKLSRLMLMQDIDGELPSAGASVSDGDTTATRRDQGRNAEANNGQLDKRNAE